MHEVIAKGILSDNNGVNHVFENIEVKEKNNEIQVRFDIEF